LTDANYRERQRSNREHDVDEKSDLAHLVFGSLGLWALGWALEWWGIYFRPRSRLLRSGVTGLGFLIMAFGLFSLAVGGWPWTWGEIFRAAVWGA
jgi:hypothetical protein